MTSCKAVQDEIQLVFDVNGSLSKSAADHIRGCTSCAQFYQQYKTAITAISGRIEQTYQQMGDPDFSFTESAAKEVDFRSPPKRLTLYLPRVAAIVAIVLIPLASYITYNRLTLRRLIKGDASAFIEELYEGAYFTLPSYIDDSDLASDLFSSKGDVFEYNIDLPTSP